MLEEVHGDCTGETHSSKISHKVGTFPSKVKGLDAGQISAFWLASTEQISSGFQSHADTTLFLQTICSLLYMSQTFAVKSGCGVDG